MAAPLRGAMDAVKAIFLTEWGGLYGDIEDPDSLITQCSLAEVDAIIADGAISKGMIPKLRAVSEALTGGVQSAHIIDGRVPHAVLLEIFTRQGIGTKLEATWV